MINKLNAIYWLPSRKEGTCAIGAHGWTTGYLVYRYMHHQWSVPILSEPGKIILKHRHILRYYTAPLFNSFKFHVIIFIIKKTHTMYSF